MTLARVIFNNARQRGLSTLLTSLSVAVGVALTVAIVTIKIESQERFQMGYSAYDLVVGAKGSPLQLVLNVVYNLDTSPGNVSYALAEKLKKDERVGQVVPYSVGDQHKGFRLVGTSDALFRDFEPRPGEPFALAAGRLFKYDEHAVLEAMSEAAKRGRKEDEKAAKARSCGKQEKCCEHGHAEVFEAVLGSVAADETGLKVGDRFTATHGVQGGVEGEAHEDSPWTVVGVLKPTGTPVDRAIYINLDSFYHIEGHVIQERSHDEAAAKPGGGAREPEAGEVSALILKVRSPIAVWSLRNDINRGGAAQAAVPAEEIRKLLSIVGNVDRILLAQAVLIVLVAAMGAALAMYNSMNERRRDIAVMRALGARRGTVFAIVTGEAVLVAALGAIMGLALGHLVVAVASPAVEAATGFGIPAWTFRQFEVSVAVGVMLLGALAGAGPAAAAYRTNVAAHLKG
ncbi:MAG: ABC transporter permease [Verrucomicrobiae bacterium]|nr:ABC transporter permease [Verrucomicrobiae bacterium]